MSAEPAPRPLAFSARRIPARATLRSPVSLPDYSLLARDLTIAWHLELSALKKRGLI